VFSQPPESRLRVLLVLEASGGGAGRHVADLALGLKARGVEVHLAYGTRRLSSPFAQGLPALQEVGVKLLPLPSLRRSPHPSDLGVLKRLLAYAEKEGPFSLLHGHSSKGGALARVLGVFLRIPVLYTPHGVVTLSPFLSPLERLVYGGAEKLLARLTDLTIAVSPWEGEALARLGYPKSRIRVIPNGVDLHPPSPEERVGVRAQLGLQEGERAVGFVGRLDLQKDPLLALESFAHFLPKEPRSKLVVVGDGPLREKLLKRAEELGVEAQLRFLGAVESRSVMPALDTLLLTSAYEGFPYVVLEALALGVPVVAAPVPGLGEWLGERGLALVAPSRGPEAVGERLAQRFRQGEAVKALRRKSMEAAAELSVKKMVEATLEAYLSVLQ
jgi:glycosyltransferase involved in cell wall biosynthesis